MIYQLIKKLISSGKTLGLETKIDVFFACNKLTEEEYEELLALLHQNKD